MQQKIGDHFSEHMSHQYGLDRFHIIGHAESDTDRSSALMKVIIFVSAVKTQHIDVIK